MRGMERSLYLNQLDIAWKNGKATAVTLRPLQDGTHAIRPPRGQQIAAITTQGKPLQFATEPDGAARIPLVAKREYVVSFR